MPATFTFLPLLTQRVSGISGSSTLFSIHNDTGKTLNVYWFDMAGNKELAAELQPGTSFAQGSFSSNAWEVSSSDGTVGFQFFATHSGAIDVTAQGTPVFTDHSEVVTHGHGGDWSTAQGYGLIDVAASLGIADLGGTLPVNTQSNYAALNSISASSAWAAGYTGKGVKIGLIDMGIAPHPEVDHSIVGGYDFSEGDNDPRADNGQYADHALSVASIIAGSHAPNRGQDVMGVAPDADLLNVRVGSSTRIRWDDVAAGIRYAVDQGAKVLCLEVQAASDTADQSFIDAVHYAYQHNVVAVVAAGNYSNYGPMGPSLVAQLSGEAIAVGNLDLMAATPFLSSNLAGATEMPWVVAPSTGYTPDSTGGYTFHLDGGTSFATPYVVGLAALLVQQNPDASVQEIMQRIVRGATISQSEATEALGERVVHGTTAPDRLQAGAGGETIEGGAGVDVVQYALGRDAYLLSRGAAGTTVIDMAGTGGRDLVQAERLAFADRTVALDVDGNAGGVYRLYQAALGRTPDQDGLGFWIAAADRGATLASIADGFVRSAEFASLYGDQPTHGTLVEAMYRNVLHRAPDQGGYDYWLDALDHRGMTATALVVAFSESGENVAAVAQVIGNGFDYVPYGA